MQILVDVGLILLGYLLGSIPFGLIWVKVISGKDIRDVASGRTGGTNAARAAGPAAGILTAFMDGAKACVAAWIAIAVVPDHHWVHALAPLAAIVGHIYPVWLRFRGGKGVATACGPSSPVISAATALTSASVSAC